MKEDGKRKETGIERIERKRGEIGGKESEEKKEREILATADTPDMCTRLAPVHTDRKATDAGAPVRKQHCATEWRENPSHFKCSHVPAYCGDRGMNDMSLILLS
jgi:hypothetical protein